jgi:hypothetical protein
MKRHILNAKEIQFIRWGQRWNGKFNALFASLFVFTVVLPALLLFMTKVPELGQAFEDAKFYTFTVALGWLITVLNERWVRIVNKLIQLDDYSPAMPPDKVFFQREKSVV